MRILFISESYGPTLYGVGQVLAHIVKYCSAAFIESKVLSCSVDYVSDNRSLVTQLPVYGVGTKNNLLGRVFRFHHRIYPIIRNEIDSFDPDLVHVHGVLTFIQVIGVLGSKKEGVPVLISPHGMLEPWLWRQKGHLYFWLKRLYWVVVLRPFISRADFVHAITDQESATLAQEFPDVPQVHISNAVDLVEYSSINFAPDTDHYLLFIGRLHPKKGVDLLIEAFEKASVEDVRLIIAGPDFDAGYTAKLRAMVESLGLSKKVSFVGSVQGDEKSKLLQKAWCTVIPSYSDVVALVNLESAASFTPTITTTMTGLSDWQEGGGLLVEPELEPLTNAILTACNWSQDERMLMGKRARSFVEERYSWDVIGEQWVEAYKMIAESREGAHE